MNQQPIYNLTDPLGLDPVALWSCRFSVAEGLTCGYSAGSSDSGGWFPPPWWPPSFCQPIFNPSRADIPDIIGWNCFGLNGNGPGQGMWLGPTWTVGGGDDAPGAGDAQKKKDLKKAALKEKNLSKCLNEFFGPGTILTNDNLPRIDASRDLPGGRFGQTDPKQVPETGRATVQIDRGIFTSLSPSDPQLVGTYLHEVANALAIQRFTDIHPRAARAYLGPRGEAPTDDQKKSFDKDIGEQFEKCIFGKR